MVSLYHQYFKTPSDPRPLNKLINALMKAIQFLKGSWDYESKPPIPSCFRSLTKVCWLLSESKPKDGADAYRYFVNDNYSLWKQMTSGANEYRSNCHNITNTEEDWKKITRDGTQRQYICQAVVEVTSGMYGTGTLETEASETTWTDRLIPPS